MHRSLQKIRNKNPFFVFTKREIIFAICIFTLGIIFGATVMTIITGKHIDNLVLSNKELETLIKDQEKQLNQLDEQFKNRLVIQKIVPFLDTDLNKHTQQEIAKKIRNLLAGLVGKELEDVDPLLLRDIINEARIIVEDHIIQLELSYIVVSDELSLYLIIKEEKNSNQED